jgi:hypothetical protein
MVLCQVQNIPIIGWLNISCQINLGNVFRVGMPFRCAFSVDTQMPLPYTFSPESSINQRAKQESFTPF